jgi:peroxiredoxin
MAQLRQDHDEFSKRDAVVLVIGPDPSDAFARFWKEKNLPFIGLPDPERRVLSQFSQEINLLKLGRMPAQMIIDKAGVARYAHYSNSMRDIPSNQEILALIDGLQEQ